MELPSLGLNCVICNRNDYLPFQCSKCDKVVCIDHRTDHGSECPLNENNFAIDPRSTSGSLKQSCDFCQKITLKLELTNCAHCLGQHCLYHRHQVQHNCWKLGDDRRAREISDMARKERQEEALVKLRESQKSSEKVSNTQPVVSPMQRYNLDPKQEALARRVRIMKLRQSARGPPNILDIDKIYFEVIYAHEPKSSLSPEDRHGRSVKLFASPKHSVGRLIDFAAMELDLTNKNHTADCDRLILRKLKNDLNNFMNLETQAPFQKYIDSHEFKSGDQLELTYELNKE